MNVSNVADVNLGVKKSMLDSQANVKPAIFEKSKQRPALILNADYRPLSYFPLSLWPWQEAIKAVYLKRVMSQPNMKKWFDQRN